MSFIDILMAIPLLWFAYKGFRKGLIVEVASLIALIAGIYLAVHFSWYIGGLISSHPGGEGKYTSLIAFAITFLGIVILVHLTGRMISRMVEHMTLGFLNRLAGAVFGLAKVAFVISVLLFLYGRFDPTMKIIPEEMRKGSLLYNPVAGIAPMVIPKLEEGKHKIDQRFAQPVNVPEANQ